MCDYDGKRERKREREEREPFNEKFGVLYKGAIQWKEEAPALLKEILEAEDAE